MTITSPCTSPCSWCRGTGYEPDPDLSSLACTLCDGGKLALISGDLGPTRTCPDGRPFVFNPGTGQIIIVRKTKTESYTLIEFVPDRYPDEAPARAWEVIKHSTGEVYHARVGGEYTTCDCKGKQSESSARGDKRAWETGDPIYFTRGCIHLDAICELIAKEVL